MKFKYISDLRPSMTGQFFTVSYAIEVFVKYDVNDSAVVTLPITITRPMNSNFIEEDTVPFPPNWQPMVQPLCQLLIPGVVPQ